MFQVINFSAPVHWC